MCARIKVHIETQNNLEKARAPMEIQIKIQRETCDDMMTAKGSLILACVCLYVGGQLGNKLNSNVTFKIKWIHCIMVQVVLDSV